MLTGAVVLGTAVCGIVQGCGPGRESAGVTPRENPPAVTDAQRDAALRHFVDGSIFETKGEYAQAALEYQEALRYEKNHAMYFALAKCYGSLNKPALAIEASREAVRLAPEKLDYRRLLGELSAAAFDLEGAAAQYEEIIARDSSALDAWYGLARVSQARKPLKALEVYERITSRFGPEWNVLLQTAELCNKLGQFDRAVVALGEMIKLDPANKELRRTLAQTCVRAGRYDEALRAYAELAELDPGNLEHRAEAAGILLLKKEYARAAEQFDTILKQDSVAVEVKVRIGELYFTQSEKDSTLLPITKTIFERIRETHPADWHAYWFLGGIASMQKDDSAAVRNFRKVTELATWNADGWVFLTSVYLAKNDFLQSLPILESAVKAVPEDFRVRFFLGVAYNRLGRNEDAARSLEKARELNPKDIEAIGQLAIVYEGMKKLDESDSLYEEALRIQPENHLILNNYGYSLAERNIQLDRALEMAKKAVEAQPENASYLDTIGWIYFRLGKYREAESFVKKAVARGDVSAVVYEHLGDIYYKLNDTEHAIEQWNAALKLDASNAELKGKISRRSL
jgi:tetratricopeptide (TPR) repeat protein